MSAIPNALVYLIAVLLQLAQPSSQMTVDYVQDGVPVMTISVTRIADTPAGIFRVVGAPAEAVPGTEAEALSFRLEQSDLYAHVYLAYADGGPPVVVDTGDARGQLVGRDTRRDLVLQTGAGTLHWLSRPPYGVLTSPADGVVLIAR